MAPPPFPPCVSAGIFLCGEAVVGPPGSYALTCQVDGEPSGAARLMAPDGSVLVEGVCARGRAIGAWFVWSEDRLVSAAAVRDGLQVGLWLRWGNGRYAHHVYDDPPPPKEP